MVILLILRSTAKTFSSSPLTRLTLPLPQDLIRSLLCEPSRRMGRMGIVDFQKHAFFKGIEWDTVRDGRRRGPPQSTWYFFVLGQRQHSLMRDFAPMPSHPGTPPHIPQLSSPTDTSHFEDVEGTAQHVSVDVLLFGPYCDGRHRSTQLTVLLPSL